MHVLYKVLSAHLLSMLWNPAMLSERSVLSAVPALTRTSHAGVGAFQAPRAVPAAGRPTQAPTRSCRRTAGASPHVLVLFLKIGISIELTYNILLVPGVQQSYSAFLHLKK